MRTAPRLRSDSASRSAAGHSQFFAPAAGIPRPVRGVRKHVIHGLLQEFMRPRRAAAQVHVGMVDDRRSKRAAKRLASSPLMPGMRMSTTPADGAGVQLRQKGLRIVCCAGPRHSSSGRIAHASSSPTRYTSGEYRA